MPALREQNQKSLGAFTNISEQAGMPVEPGGDTYQYVGDRIPQKGAAQIGAERQAKQEEEIFDRDKFEEIWLNKIGGNPFMMDEEKELKKIQDERLPALFNHVFPDMSWEDRNRMDPEDQKYWQKALLQFNRYHRDQLGAKKKQLLSAYNYGMENFDKRATAAQARKKEQAAAMTAKETERKEGIKRAKESEKQYLEDMRRIGELEKKKAELDEASDTEILTAAFLSSAKLSKSPLSGMIGQKMDSATKKRIVDWIDKEIEYRQTRSFPDQETGQMQKDGGEFMPIENFKAKYGLGGQ